MLSWVNSKATILGKMRKTEITDIIFVPDVVMLSFVSSFGLALGTFLVNSKSEYVHEQYHSIIYTITKTSLNLQINSSLFWYMP